MPHNLNISTMDRQAIKQMVTEHQEMSRFRLGKYFGSLDSASGFDSPAYRPPANKGRKGAEAGKNRTRDSPKRKISKKDQTKLKSKSHQAETDTNITLELNNEGNVRNKNESSMGNQSLLSKSKTKRKSVTFFDASSKRSKKDQIEMDKSDFVQTSQNVSEAENVSKLSEAGNTHENVKYSYDVSKNTKANNESWARSNEMIVTAAVDEIRRDLAFRGNLKMKFEDKLLKDGLDLDKLLPKLEIKKILKKCNEKDQKARNKLQIDKDVRHLVFTECKRFEKSSSTSLSFWKEGESNVYFTPSSACDVSLNANQSQFLEYETLVRGILNKKKNIKHLLENMNDVDRLHNMVQTAKKTFSNLKTSCTVESSQRESIDTNVKKLEKNAEELSYRLKYGHGNQGEHRDVTSQIE